MPYVGCSGRSLRYSSLATIFPSRRTSIAQNNNNNNKKQNKNTSISFSFPIDLLDHSWPALPLTSFSKSSYVSLNYWSSFVIDLLPTTFFLLYCVFPTQLSELPESKSSLSLVIWTSITSLTLSLDILFLVHSALGHFLFSVLWICQGAFCPGTVTLIIYSSWYGLPLNIWCLTPCISFLGMLWHTTDLYNGNSFSYRSLG